MKYMKNHNIVKTEIDFKNKKIKGLSDSNVRIIAIGFFASVIYGIKRYFNSSDKKKTDLPLEEDLQSFVEKTTQVQVIEQSILETLSVMGSGYGEARSKDLLLFETVKSHNLIDNQKKVWDAYYSCLKKEWLTEDAETCRVKITDIGKNKIL